MNDLYLVSLPLSSFITECLNCNSFDFRDYFGFICLAFCNGSVSADNCYAIFVCKCESVRIGQREYNIVFGIGLGIILCLIILLVCPTKMETEGTLSLT